MGASLRDRAGRPSDGAPAGLRDTATIPSAADQFETVSMGCWAILHRLETEGPQYYAETIEDLERRHDRLEEEVRNLIGMVRTLANAIATETRRAADSEAGAVHEGADPKGIAQ